MATGFDPEAEQEVDFARYGRMLARRWWLVAVGVVAGAVIGYLVSLGGTQLYSATATIYLGQPYNPGATAPVLTLQTNPAAVSQIANAEAVDAKVATQCNTTLKSFHKGISVQRVASSTPVKGLGAQVNPLVTVTVQASKGKVATCAANALARAAVAGLGTYPEAKITKYEQRIAQDTEAIKSINAALVDPALAQTDKYLLQQRLQIPQTDLNTTSQLLIFAKTVEMPRLTIPARERQVTAQSSRDTVLIAAIIGLILGVLAALLWDGLVPRLTARNGG
ncbi:MAG: Chain length determinant protein [Gaiellaceae bacterium]|nr:Chain length determinant protein [Gaiellaceae bacterium]